MPCILVVEDNEGVRDFIAETLRDVGGYEVDACATEAEALDRARERDYDLYVVDLYLSSSDIEADGLDLLRALHEKNPDGRFVMMSGKSFASHVETAVLELGITDFLAKPLSVKDLLAKIRRALR